MVFLLSPVYSERSLNLTLPRNISSVRRSVFLLVTTGPGVVSYHLV